MLLFFGALFPSGIFGGQIPERADIKANCGMNVAQNWTEHKKRLPSNWCLSAGTFVMAFKCTSDNCNSSLKRMSPIKVILSTPPRRLSYVV